MKKIILLAILIFQFRIYADDNYFKPVFNDENNYLSKKEKFNYENNLEIKRIFRDIFDLHFEVWKEEFKRQINSSEKKFNYQDNLKLDNNKAIEDEKIEKSLHILYGIIDSENNSLAYAEACFKLALFGYYTKKLNAVQAVGILENGLKTPFLAKDNKKLYVRMNLFAGSLSIASENYSAAKKYYNSILKMYLDPDEFREEKMRAFIGYGDAEFELFHFGEALNVYKKGYVYGKKFIEINENAYVLLIGEIKLRLLWAAYRNANYAAAIEFAQDFAREKQRYDNLISQHVLEDVVRVAAISLYERHNLDSYLALANDKGAGDFGKKMIINSFYYFTYSGNPKEVETYAKPIEQLFYSSRLLPYFIKARLIALNYDNNKDKLNELAYLGTAFIEKKSIWFNRFSLNKFEEENRQEMIKIYSIDAGNYYYNLGMITKSRSAFLKSAQIYHSRILENFPGDLRGVLFQSFAQSLMMGEDYKLAWEAIEESLKQPLTEDNLKTAWFLMVNIARVQSQDARDTSADEFKKYENAVDGYIAHFPADFQARIALFESAKRAEELNDLANARNRYEKILSCPPLFFKEQDQEEKDKVSLALARLFQKMDAEDKSVADGAGTLEKIAQDNKISDTVHKVVMLANYNSAIEYAKKLKTNGEMLKSAKFLDLWSKNYLNNPNVGDALIQSMKEFAALQNWEHVNTLALYFSMNLPSNKRINEAIFWQAKSSDKLLQFSLASLLYDKSSYNDDIFPSNEQKKFALKRASEIYQMLNKSEDAARMLEKLSLIDFKSKENNNEIAKIEIESANKYFASKQYIISGKLYQKVLRRNNIEENLKNSANIGLMAVNLYLNKNRNISENKLDNFIKLLLEKNKISLKNENLKLINNAVFLANNFDEQEFDKANDKNFSQISLKNIKNMINSKNFIKKRSDTLRNYKLLKEPFVHTNLILGKMSLSLSDSYSLLYKGGERKDIYLLSSNQLKNEAKKYLYEGLTQVENNSDDQIGISNLLDRYTNRKFHVFPEAKIQDEQSPSYILEILPLSLIDVRAVANAGEFK
ncbi:hypothetical protein [Silvanigrella aquatica]|uniref:Uncharacterized protein n=1 Tax=Silvanigrella aquatica TaxID=1915309 RepID=A0A1L4CXI4_9BACT|nr:hypothetical protein [Silvanigrella aquatica]APJ02655.1 hypothetical protein AXG55_01390 [Silvanigrella aquatica]